MQIQADRLNRRRCSVITRKGTQCQNPSVLGDRCLLHQADKKYRHVRRKGYWLDGRYYLPPVPATVDELVAEGLLQPTKEAQRRGDEYI
jgi:hypothetical protein